MIIRVLIVTWVAFFAFVLPAFSVPVPTPPWVRSCKQQLYYPRVVYQSIERIQSGLRIGAEESFAILPTRFLFSKKWGRGLYRRTKGLEQGLLFDPRVARSDDRILSLLNGGMEEIRDDVMPVGTFIVDLLNASKIQERKFMLFAANIVRFEAGVAKHEWVEFEDRDHVDETEITAVFVPVGAGPFGRDRHGRVIQSRRGDTFTFSGTVRETETSQLVRAYKHWTSVVGGVSPTPRLIVGFSIASEPEGELRSPGGARRETQ